MSKYYLSDGVGYVELLGFMGDDTTVVNAARVSFNKEVSSVNDADIKLIKYLAKHNHWTPFSQVQFQFRIKMPIFVARQWFKHQVGFTRNEVSRRYVKSAPTYFIPEALREAATNVKQGSSNTIVRENSYFCGLMETAVNSADAVYHQLLEAGVCPEQARMVLPQSMYTEFVETASLAAYARLVKQRTDPHAQQEIQEYTLRLDDILIGIDSLKHSWDALTLGRYGKE